MRQRSTVQNSSCRKSIEGIRNPAQTDVITRLTDEKAPEASRFAQ